MTKEFIKVNLSEIVPYERNNKKHGDNVKRIADSIQRNEYISPIIIDEDNIILAGHGRKLALESLGIGQEEVLKVYGLTPKQKSDFRIADNITTELSERDLEAVIAEIEDFELEELKLDFPDLDFDDNDLDEELEDEVPEMKADIIVEKGDIFQLGEHRLMCGDSTNIDDVEKLMDGEKADCVYTDPPYGMFLDTDYSKMEGKMGIKSGKKYGEVLGDGDDFDPAFISTVLTCFDYCPEIFFWGADYYAEHLLPYKNDGSRVVRDKRRDEKQDKGFGSTFELCWSKARHKRDTARVEWFGCFSGAESRNRIHPTQKPTALYKRFSSRRGKRDLVADLYGGSGSTLIACEDEGTICYMNEYEPKYIQVILKRYHDYTKGQKEIKCLNRDLDLSPILNDE